VGELLRIAQYRDDQLLYDLHRRLNDLAEELALYLDGPDPVTAANE
jgi:hypothetical protein